MTLTILSIESCIFVTWYQLTDAALAHELVATNGEPGADYYVLLGRLKIQQKSFIEAEENLKQAIVLKHQVGLLQSCLASVLSFFFCALHTQ